MKKKKGAPLDRVPRAATAVGPRKKRPLSPGHNASGSPSPAFESVRRQEMSSRRLSGIGPTQTMPTGPSSSSRSSSPSLALRTSHLMSSQHALHPATFDAPATPREGVENSNAVNAPSAGVEDISRVRVSCRIRPATPREAHAPIAVRLTPGVNGSWPKDLILAQTSSVAATTRARQRYSLDSVFPDTATQAGVFENTTQPLVEAVVAGVNAALFAYGQTGTGKTHTMLGVDIWQMLERTQGGGEIAPNIRASLEASEQRGMIPRAMQALFDLLKQRQHKISVTYLELYNEKVLDLLLQPGTASPHMGTAPMTPGGSNLNGGGLELREDKSGFVNVIGATVKRVQNMKDVLDCLWRGAKNRAVSATDMNEHSSRSHTIFQVLVETRATPTMKGTRAKLYLVDLAGSEKWRTHQLTGFSEQRIVEMTSINQSLSNLGQCVRALLQSGRQHIPFRNSKLTRLLQDALQGNTKLGFVVCVSPSEHAFDETTSTLQFADRAKRIVVKRTETALEEETIVASTTIASSSAGEDQGLKQHARPAVVVSDDHAKDLLTALKKRAGASTTEETRESIELYRAAVRGRDVETLSAGERLALAEWSVVLQAESVLRHQKAHEEQLETATKTAGEQVEKLNRELELARAEIRALSSEIKGKDSEIELWRTKAQVAQDEAARTSAEMTKAQEQLRLQHQLQAKAAEPLQAPSYSRPATPTRETKEDVDGGISIRFYDSSASNHASQKQGAAREAGASAQKSKPPTRVVDVSSFANPADAANPTSPRQTARHSSPSLERASYLSTSRAHFNNAPSSPSVRFQELPSRASAIRPSSPRPSVASTPLSRRSLVEPGESSGARPVISASSGMAPPPPKVWESFVDQKSGKTYYYCRKTGETTWKRPDGWVRDAASTA